MGPSVHASPEQPAQAALLGRTAVPALRARTTLWAGTTLPRVLATRFATFPPHSRFTSASTRCEPVMHNRCCQATVLNASRISHDCVVTYRLTDLGAFISPLLGLRAHLP